MTTIFYGLPTSSGVVRDFRNNNINNVTTNRIPFYPTTFLPQAAPANKGQIIYDTTKNEFCYCNGTAWICLSAGSAGTAGIVDCTVGSVANPNADYNSVQAALTAGCRNIRLLDGLVGGQVPGYFEPGPVAFSAVGAPVMIYIDPGVDWELRQSVVGTGGIDMTGSVVTFRGSGFASIMRQLQDGGVPASVFALNDASLIQWMDLTFVTSADAVAFPVPMGRLIWRNCQYILISASLAVYSFTTIGNSAGNQIEFHECTFIAFDITSRMIDNADAGNNGALTLTNCTHQGSSLDPAVDVTYRFGTVGGQITVEGFEIFGTDPMSINFGGTLSSYNSIYQNGVGAVTAIIDGTHHLSNSRFDTMVFASGLNNISNIEVTGATAVDISTGFNHLDDIFFEAAALTLSGVANILEGGAALSLTITGAQTRVSNYRATTFLTLGIAGGVSAISGVDSFGPAIISSNNNVITNLDCTGFTLSGDNNLVSGLNSRTAILCIISGTGNTISNLKTILEGISITGPRTILDGFSCGSFMAADPQDLVVSGSDSIISNGQVGNIMTLSGSIHVSNIHCFGINAGDTTIIGSTTGTASFLTVDQCQFDAQDVTCILGNWRLSNCLLEGSDLNFIAGAANSSDIQIINNRLVAGVGNFGNITSASNDFSLNRVHIEGNILDGIITQTDATIGERSGCIISNNTIRNTGGAADAFVSLHTATNIAITTGYKVINNHFVTGNIAFQNAAVTPILANVEIGGNRIDAGRIDVFDAVAVGAVVSGVDIHDNNVVDNTATAIAVGAVSVVADTVVKVSNNIVGTLFDGTGASGITIPVNGGAGFPRTLAVGNVLGGGAFSAAPEVSAGNLLT